MTYQFTLVSGTWSAREHCASSSRLVSSIGSLTNRRPCALALDLDGDASNFTAFLQASPESFAVVEFFTHWSAPCL